MQFSLKKRRLPFILFAIFLLVQSVIIVKRFNFWPASHYPMFSNSKESTQVQAFQLFASSTKSGQKTQVPIAGPKQNWFLLNRIVRNDASNNDKLAAREVMIENFKYFQLKNPSAATQADELHLYVTESKKSALAASPTLNSTLVFSVKL